jgi:hypothetical protein
MGGSTTGWVPPGWPGRVRPPGSPEWESSAAAFLFDCCPADYRGYSVLGKHPVVLAVFAQAHVEAQLAASKSGLSSLRARLGVLVPIEVVAEAVDAWQEQQAQLQRLLREVGLISAGLRGEVFRRRL